MSDNNRLSHATGPVYNKPIVRKSLNRKKLTPIHACNRPIRAATKNARAPKSLLMTSVPNSSSTSIIVQQFGEGGGGEGGGLQHLL